MQKAGHSQTALHKLVACAQRGAAADKQVSLMPVASTCHTPRSTLPLFVTRRASLILQSFSGHRMQSIVSMDGALHHCQLHPAA